MATSCGFRSASRGAHSTCHTPPCTASLFSCSDSACAPCSPPSPCQVLKFSVGLAYISTLVLSLTGALPFSCFTSVIVAYGMAGEMVKLAENNLMSEWGRSVLGGAASHSMELVCHTLGPGGQGLAGALRLWCDLRRDEAD